MQNVTPLTPLIERLQAVRQCILEDPEGFDYSTPDRDCGCIHRTVDIIFHSEAQVFFRDMSDDDLAWLLLPNCRSTMNTNEDYKPLTWLNFALMNNLLDRGLAEAIKRIDYLITKYSKDISNAE